MVNYGKNLELDHSWQLSISERFCEASKAADFVP